MILKNPFDAKLIMEDGGKRYLIKHRFRSFLI